MHARLLNSIGTTKIGHALRSYFYSGWAFLIPYLAVYLLYYATKWPVNPSIRSEHLVAGGHQGWAPCMLHVYWALHAIHAIGAGVALWSWWKQRTSDLTTDYANEHGLNSNPPEAGTPLAHEAGVSSPLNVERPLTPSANYQLPTTNYSEIFFRLAPWLLLALLFYIPGVYLEWPSDPWEHLRRINEWRILDTVGAHSSWHKSAYFIPYSLLSWCIGLRQLFWLDFYYTGICLLLCWQYYRFSRACGLGERASMIFVIIQAILFGNNIFSFYRYYGISSSIYAQLDAIALTRIVLEFASRGTKLDPVFCHTDHGVPTQSQNLEAGRGEDKSQHPTPITQSPTPHTATPLAPRVTPAASDNRPLTSSYWPLPSVLWLLASGFCLLTLTAFNHSQGLGIAGLGIAAIIVWRLIEWKRTTLWWLIGGTIVINALFLWLYPRPPVIETYRTQGWLNAWYGFNILDLTSPAGDRIAQIISTAGLINIAVALLQLRQNKIVGWLTLVSFVALISPALSVPLAMTVARSADYYIVTFQRLLLSIPFGLAIVSAVGGEIRVSTNPVSGAFNSLTRGIAYLSTATVTGLCVTGYTYDRFWHSIYRVPADLSLQAPAVSGKNWYEKPAYIYPSGTRRFTLQPEAAYAFSERHAEISRPPSIRLQDELGRLGIPPSTEAIQQAPALCLDKNEPRSLLSSDPNQPSHWSRLNGSQPVFSSTLGAPELRMLVISNPVGQTSTIFHEDYVPVARCFTYRICISAKSLNGSPRIYLAVAWYDENRRPLPSNTPAPSGANWPTGWNNGDFSYFGPTDSPPSVWTDFVIDFGWGCQHAIPPNARFARFGALLNHNQEKEAVVAIRSFGFVQARLRETVYEIPDQTETYTPYSQAAFMSKHWPAQYVAITNGGSCELRRAAERHRARSGN